MRIIFTLLALLFLSCKSKKETLPLEAAELFGIDYGSFEEQLSMFNVATPEGSATSLYMRDGFFYITNGEAQKIVSYNSYGDILSLAYNKIFYSSLSPSFFTKPFVKAIDYPFTIKDRIVVDKNKNIYVSASLPKEQSEEKQGGEEIYSEVVLKISELTGEISYIGQEGLFSTPFSHIHSLSVTEDDELVVLSKTADGFLFYWLTKDGYLYKAGTLDPESVIPSIGGALVNLTNAVPLSKNGKRAFYVAVDSYAYHVDEQSKMPLGTDYEKTALYYFDVDGKDKQEPFEILPYQEVEVKDFTKLIFSLPYDFIGVSGEWLFFMLSVKDGFALEMVNTRTNEVVRRNIEMNKENILYYSLSLSADGIISALLAEEKSAKVVWWRTDKLMKSLANN